MPIKIYTDEECRLRMNDRARVRYNLNNPSAKPRHLRLVDLSEEALEKVKAKQEYFKAYYKQHREKMLGKSNTWNHTHKGLAQVTTIE